MSEYQIAETHLRQVDPKLAVLIERLGPCRMGRQPDAWRALSSSIIAQQVSTYAARAIGARFSALQAEREYPTPQYILQQPDEVLRAAGLSGNKTRSIRDLAEHFVEGKIVPEQFVDMDDEAVIAALLPVRGIGRWTAESFLRHGLGRPDVLAVDDLGLRKAMQQLYDLPGLPSPQQMRLIAEPWRPYRSVASWYLWRWLDNPQ